MIADWDKIVAVILGVYGAALTTYTVWDKRRDKHPTVKVSLAQGIPIFGHGAGDPMLTIRAANHGDKPLKFSGVGLYHRKTKQHAPIFSPRADRQFPCTVPPGESVSVFLDMKETAADLLAEGLGDTIKIQAYITDAADRKFTSNTFKFRLREWAAWQRRSE
jgi:hypothetical protein